MGDRKMQDNSYLNVGDKAPDFTLPSGDNGKLVSLSDFLGKRNVVLYFYPKDESIGCTMEACSFRDELSEFKGVDAEVIGINSDSVESHAKFSEHHRLPFTLLSDGKKDVIRKYRAKALFIGSTKRITYVIDKSGVIREIISSLRPKPHVQGALEALKAIEQQEEQKQTPQA